MLFRGSVCVVTGGDGFIGQHLVRRLKEEGAQVLVFDKERGDDVANFCLTKRVDCIFHLAAMSRTPPCIEDPVGCYVTNVLGTIRVLEEARMRKVPRVVMASSNVVLAADTPYKTSKEALERLVDVYSNLYSQSVIALRFSNVYGSGFKYDDIAVFQSLLRSKLENGYLTITGDGEQSRDYTHVSDIVEGLLKAAQSSYCGTIDLCTGINTTLNEVSKFFDCPVKYIGDRFGDIKHIKQSPDRAKAILGWEAKVKLADGIKDVINAPQPV